MLCYLVWIKFTLKAKYKNLFIPKNIINNKIKEVAVIKIPNIIKDSNFSCSTVYGILKNYEFIRHKYQSVQALLVLRQWATNTFQFQRLVHLSWFTNCWSVLPWCQSNWLRVCGIYELNNFLDELVLISRQNSIPIRGRTFYNNNYSSTSLDYLMELLIEPDLQENVRAVEQCAAKCIEQ